MEASMLTFTKEFKEKTKKGLSRRQIGELRWKKLQEADRLGALQGVQNRQQLGALVGITQSKLYYAWTNSLLKRGRISETLRGFENGKAVYEYHIENAEKPKTMPNVSTPSVVLPDTPTASVDIKPLNIVMTITTANTIIKLENLDANSAVEIIKAVSK